MIIWLWLLLLLCGSGFVSASETALFGLSRQALHRFGRSHRPALRRVFALMQEPQRVLMTVLIANTAINVAIFSTSFIALREARRTHAGAAFVGGILVLLAVIIFGEILPKNLALACAERFAPSAAAAIQVVQTVLAPLRLILRTLLVTPIIRLITPSVKASPITMEELRELVEHSARDGVINSREHEMLQATVAAAHASVREIMTPRVDIQAVRVDCPREKVLERLSEAAAPRLLVYGTDLDDLYGVVSARDIYLKPGAPLEKLVQPIIFVPEQVKIMILLRNLQQEDAKLAIVVDEYGGTAGFVSIQHVMNWILGGPSGEDDKAAPSTERIDENTYRVSGNLSARLWADRFTVRGIDRRIDTVGGLVLAKLGRMPGVGDVVRISNVSLTVESVRKRRIERVLLKRDADETGSKGATT